MQDDAYNMPIVVFDMDGTILRVNSFPLWVLFLIGGRVPGLGLRRRLRLSLQCQWLLIRRKLLHDSHDELLFRLQRAWEAATGGDINAVRFENTLLRRVRTNLASVLQMVASKQIDAVLATAAAADYAESLGRRLGFLDVLATSSRRNLGEANNSGVRKREGVLALLKQRGWDARPIILFTDHMDDLPLMHESDVVCWFGSATAVLDVAQAARTRLVFCRDLDDESASTLLRSLCSRYPKRIREMATL
jgi:phosphoserine phosphatase